MTRPLANLDASRGDYDAVDAALRGSPSGRAFLAKLEQRIRDGDRPLTPLASSIPATVANELRRIALGLQNALAEFTGAMAHKPFIDGLSAIAEEAQDIAWTFRERDGDANLSARLDGLYAEIASSATALDGHRIAGGIDGLRTHVADLMQLFAGASHTATPDPAPAKPEISPARPPFDAEPAADVRKLSPAEALCLFS